MRDRRAVEHYDADGQRLEGVARALDALVSRPVDAPEPVARAQELARAQDDVPGSLLAQRDVADEEPFADRVRGDQQHAPRQLGVAQDLLRDDFVAAVILDGPLRRHEERPHGQRQQGRAAPGRCAEPRPQRRDARRPQRDPGGRERDEVPRLLAGRNEEEADQMTDRPGDERGPQPRAARRLARDRPRRRRRARGRRSPRAGRAPRRRPAARAGRSPRLGEGAAAPRRVRDVPREQVPRRAEHRRSRGPRATGRGAASAPSVR